MKQTESGRREASWIQISGVHSPCKLWAATFWSNWCSLGGWIDDWQPRVQRQANSGHECLPIFRSFSALLWKLHALTYRPSTLPNENETKQVFMLLFDCLYSFQFNQICWGWSCCETCEKQDKRSTLLFCGALAPTTTPTAFVAVPVTVSLDPSGSVSCGWKVPIWRW